MTKSDILSILAAVYPQDLIVALIESYEKAIKEYRKCNWSYFGNEIGQFIEVARRMIEFQLEGKYTALSDKLRNFNEKILVDYENHDKKYPEIYRIIIPRCLYSMYCLRNKRGMIHKNHISPNQMDATVLLSNTKWILSEFFRMVSTKSFEETESIINSIICKETFIVWDTGSCLRILNTKMSAKQKILCLLYIKDNQTDVELQRSVEYKNTSNFRILLGRMHKERLIEYGKQKCMLSPLGIEKAESLLIV